MDPHQNHFYLQLSDDGDCDRILKICHALSNPERLRIVRFLYDRSKNLSELKNELSMPISSVSRHIDILENAGILEVMYEPGPKGHTKFCSYKLAGFTVSFVGTPDYRPEEETFTMEMPIGMFSECRVVPPCGMLGATERIGTFDDPDVFYSPHRHQAECIWFNTGELSYNFPNHKFMNRPVTELSFSFEICSEAKYYNNKWPSDITVCINGAEAATFTSPGDFGGRRGKFTPDYWPITSTQFGLLKKITINSEGVFVDNAPENKSLTINDLKLDKAPCINLKIGVKDTAVHKGGINLFGRHFGDYNQSVIMTVK